jgi:truncated hemoglobin YjbI
MRTETDSTAAAGEESMYGRVGGADAVRTVVDRLYVLVLEDEQLRPYFETVELPQLKGHMVALLSQILGGPRLYQGRDLAEAHLPLGISNEHYARVGDYLMAALLVAHAPHDIVNAVTGVLESTRDSIVVDGGTAGAAVDDGSGATVRVS